MPSSMCCPLGDWLQRSIGSSLHCRCSSGAKTPALLMQPPRLVEVATSGAVVTRYGATAGLRASSTSDPAERLLGRDRLGRRAARCSPAPSTAGWPSAGRGPAARAGALTQHARPAWPGRAAPTRCSRPGRSLGAASSTWVGGEQRGVVERVAGDRQAPALDRVGEEHARPVADLRRTRGSAASSASRSWPPRSVTSGASSSSECSAHAGPRPRSARRRGSACAASAPGRPKSDWYSSLGMSSIQARSDSPPGSAKAACSRRPYFASTTCQPAASELRRASWSIRTPGTTRSSDWRLRSTIQVTLPRPVVAGSATASQTLPSSSSASPMSAMNRRARPLAEVRVDVAAGQRGEERRGGAQTDRAGREVDDVGVLACGTGTTAGRRGRGAGSGRSGRGCRAGTGSRGRPATRAA